jgi:transcriptional regulator with XRE-family HTH domain
VEQKSPGEQVAASVRAELARQRKSGSALARHLGLPQSAVSRRLLGHVPFDVDQLAATAAWLNVPITDLLPAGSEAGAA